MISTFRSARESRASSQARAEAWPSGTQASQTVFIPAKAAVHSSVHNHFNQGRSLSRRDHLKINRAVALAEWRTLLAA